MQELQFGDGVQVGKVLQNGLTKRSLVIDDVMAGIACVQEQGSSIMIFCCQLRKPINDEDFLIQGFRQTCPVGMERNGPEPALILMVSDKELFLRQDELIILQACRQQRIARLFQPGIHKTSHVLARCCGQGVPEVLTDGVAVLVLLKIRV